MVPKTSQDAYSTNLSHSKSSDHPFNASKESKDSPTFPQTQTDGLSLIREKFKLDGIKDRVIDTLLKGWRPNTLKQYQVYLKRWRKFCNKENIDPLVRNEIKALEFLQQLFNQGYSYSAINTARSALSSIFDKPPLGDSSLFTRFLRSVYNARPNLPRYTCTWNVSTVLNYLKNVAPPKYLSLYQLSLKLVTIMALVTGQRLQTLKALDLDYCKISKETITFHIMSLLKHSTPANKTDNVITFEAYHDKRLCPVFLLHHYLKRTKNLRSGSQLLVNHQKPHKGVSKETISRWVKLTLTKAGINTAIFKPHSTRSASTSAAAANSLDISKILKAASWTHASTFHKFYRRDIAKSTSSFGNVVLKTC